MSCGCANRMRKYVLPEAGYILDEETKVWVNKNTGDKIPDGEVEHHHTRLILKEKELRKAAGRAAAKELLGILNNNV